VVLAGLALGWCGRLCGTALAGVSARRRARRAAAALAGSLLFTLAGLAMLALPALVAVIPRRDLAAWPRLVAGSGPGAEAAAWLAVALLAASACAVAARALELLRRRRVLRAEPGIGSHEPRPGFDLVTLPGAAVVAYSLGGRRPQVVLSQGLCARLGSDGVAAVLAHEAAHVQARHDRWLLLVALCEAALWFAPWASRASRAVRVALECWADEEAARQVGRKALRGALLGAAGIAPIPWAAPALSGADWLSGSRCSPHTSRHRLAGPAGQTYPRWQPWPPRRYRARAVSGWRWPSCTSCAGPDRHPVPGRPRHCPANSYML
jgi:Zn-dependent protease with chaperone function